MSQTKGYLLPTMNGQISQVVCMPYSIKYFGHAPIYNSDGPSCIEIFDKDGRIVESKLYDDEQEFIIGKAFEYIDGVCKSCLIQPRPHSRGSRNVKFKHIYDDLPKELKDQKEPSPYFTSEITYGLNRYRSPEWECNYDDFHRIVEIRKTTPTKYYDLSMIEFEYDEHGNVVKELRYNGTKHLLESFRVWYYEYFDEPENVTINDEDIEEFNSPMAVPF